ncbi:hypothetical protein HDV57DRAFT_481835 [Trichoderma longibrachiatum]|uniref:Uncharacterized protein n=1 Tax=Trichoderma longibrachiatum ATCC 18648 TaxID=983965 RepID=A0A2T4BP45_TRILO|nr:hypothetical protein M440DRAFT_1406879 [Trichoderma longibrachiatum ATCC 18648]
MDRKPEGNGPDEAASSSPFSPNRKSSPLNPMDSKGKQKAWPESAASRLEASAKLVVNAITSSREMPALVSESKSSSGSRSLPSLSGIAGEASSPSSHQQTPFEQRRMAANECHNDMFDSFVENHAGVLAIDGHYEGVSETSFAIQEASDGLAVVDLLCQPGDEFPSALSGQAHDLRALEDDDPWLEAAIGSADDPEDQLDFTPDFLTRPELSAEAELYLGTEDTQETSRTWLGYWSEVFATYNARVWGNSHPPSSGSHPQEEPGSSEPTTMNRALSRLKQILFHLK